MSKMIDKTLISDYGLELIPIPSSTTFKYFCNWLAKNLVRDLHERYIAYRISTEVKIIDSEFLFQNFLKSNIKEIYAYKKNKQCPNIKDFMTDTSSQSSGKAKTPFPFGSHEKQSSSIEQKTLSNEANNNTQFQKEDKHFTAGFLKLEKQIENFTNYQIDFNGKMAEKEKQSQEQIKVLLLTIQTQAKQQLELNNKMTSLQKQMESLLLQNASSSKNQHIIKCSNCKIDKIKDRRFKCAFCSNYDICEDCYNKNSKNQTNDHNTFMIIEDLNEYQKKLLLSTQHSKEDMTPQYSQQVNDLSDQKSNFIDDSISSNPRKDTDIDKSSNSNQFSNNKNPTTITNDTIRNDLNCQLKHKEDEQKSKEKDFIIVSKKEYIFNLLPDDNYYEVVINYNSSFSKIKIINLPDSSTIEPIKNEIFYEDKIIRFTFDQLIHYDPKIKFAFYFKLESISETPSIQTKPCSIILKRSFKK